MNKNLGIVTFISFVNAMSLAVVVPIVYPYAKQYGLTDLEASLLLTIFSLSQFIATPVIGRLSDYYGRKPLLVVSLFGTFLSNILAAVAPSAAFLFLARLLDGITGGNNSVAQAVISDTTTPEERAKGFGFFGAAFGFAFIIGPIISLFLQQISLAAPYVASALFALAATLVTAYALPETLKTKETAKLTFASLGFEQLLTGLRMPIINVILIINFLSSLMFGVFQFAFQPYVLNTFNVGTQSISLILTIYGVVSVFMQAFAIRRLTKRFGLIKLLYFGLLGNSAVLAMMLLPREFWLFVMVAPLFAITTSLARPILSALMSTNSRPEDQGIALGLTESYFSLATAVGPVIGGVLAAGGYGLPLFIGSGISLVAFLFTVAVNNKLRSPHQAPNF
jgi:MFS family permease